MIDAYGGSTHVELQQRSVEYSNIFTKYENMRLDDSTCIPNTDISSPFEVHVIHSSNAQQKKFWVFILCVCIFYKKINFAFW